MFLILKKLNYRSSPCKMHFSLTIIMNIVQSLESLTSLPCVFLIHLHKPKLRKTESLVELFSFFFFFFIFYFFFFFFFFSIIFRLYLNGYHSFGKHVQHAPCCQYFSGSKCLGIRLLRNRNQVFEKRTPAILLKCLNNEH